MAVVMIAVIMIAGRGLACIGTESHDKECERRSDSQNAL
jgi:hypothetical protein